jgi:hypothetical protein
MDGGHLDRHGGELWTGVDDISSNRHNPFKISARSTIRYSILFSLPVWLVLRLPKYENMNAPAATLVISGS